MGDEPSVGPVGIDHTDELREAIDRIDVPGFWRGQILYTGVKLGIFEVIDGSPIRAADLAATLQTDPAYTYRLLRALAHFDVVTEDADHRFSLTPVGELFQKDHDQSVRDLVLFFGSPDYRSAWFRLPDIVTEGGPSGFVREFGCELFDYLDQNPELATAFSGAMSFRTQMVTGEVVDILEATISERSHICDVGGGHGYLLCRLLQERPSLEGTVLDLPEVVAAETRHWGQTMGVDGRCRYVGGDMFESVPEADTYVMKSILHDWPDDDCVDILSTIHTCAPDGAEVFVIDRLVPGPNTTDSSKASDINMMVATGGRERTLEEFKALFDDANWSFVETHIPENSKYSVVEGLKDEAVPEE